MAELKQKNVRVLTRRNLESYLFDDEVLRALACSVGRSEDAEALLAAKKDVRAVRVGDAPNDLKPASGQIYNACRDVLGLANAGSNVRAFMRDTLAPLVKPGMSVYDELERDIFGHEEVADER